MNLIYNPIFLEHDTGTHPENQNRLEGFKNLPVTDIQNSEKYLTLFHTPEYIQKIKNNRAHLFELDADTIISENTYNAAVAAVGATVMASEKDDFALVRPPGHHAYPDHSSGFCIFNNISIAVQNLINQKKRVFILDFDGHLGDGTERYFYKTDQVLYWSLHQHPAFPGWGTIDEIGDGRGEGYTLNIPLMAGSGDDVYVHALQEFWSIPMQFRPDVVAVSAGFDGHHADSLLKLNLTTNTYYEIGKLLRSSFNHIFATLEGGYNTETLPHCIYSFLDGINGKPNHEFEDRSESTVLIIEDVETKTHILKEKLQKYWKIGK